MPYSIAVAGAGLLAVMAPAAFAARQLQPAEATSVTVPLNRQSLAEQEIATYRSIGYHCLKGFDASNASIVGQVKAHRGRAETFSAVETAIAPVSNGRHDLVMVYTVADNAGRQVVHQAHAWVEHSTCEAHVLDWG